MSTSRVLTAVKSDLVRLKPVLSQDNLNLMWKTILEVCKKFNCPDKDGRRREAMYWCDEFIKIYQNHTIFDKNVLLDFDKLNKEQDQYPSYRLLIEKINAGLKPYEVCLDDLLKQVSAPQSIPQRKLINYVSEIEVDLALLPREPHHSTSNSRLDEDPLFLMDDWDDLTHRLRTLSSATTASPLSSEQQEADDQSHTHRLSPIRD